MRWNWNGGVFFVRAFGILGFWMEIERMVGELMFGSDHSRGLAHLAFETHKRDQKIRATSHVSRISDGGLLHEIVDYFGRSPHR